MFHKQDSLFVRYLVEHSRKRDLYFTFKATEMSQSHSPLLLTKPTQVYHEIILGYLDYVKQRGYVYAHIWACPPHEGDDYIFHCHPENQKTPKPKRLQEWYKTILDKGKSEGIVFEYKVSGPPQKVATQV